MVVLVGLSVAGSGAEALADQRQVAPADVPSAVRTLMLPDLFEQLPAEGAAGAIDSQQPTAIRDLGAPLLAGHAERTGVGVDPRYGVRDGLASRVVPADDGL